MRAVLEAGIRSLAGFLSPAGSNARLSILIYHRVLAQPDSLNDSDPTAEVFAAQMRALSAHFTPLPVSEAVERLAAGRLPSRAVCVTFDDGYADNAEVALPILLRYRIPATVFVATGFLNGGRMWNDTVVEAIRRVDGPTIALEDPALEAIAVGSLAAKKAAIRKVLAVWRRRPPAERRARADALAARVGATLPADLTMRDDQVRMLRSAGMEIGAHTVSHPILRTLSAGEARDEIAESREHLQALLGEPVRLFAYPNGRPNLDYSAEHTRIVRELGFDAAVSTAVGVATRRRDPYQLPRFTPWDREPLVFSTRLVANLRRVSVDQVRVGGTA